MAHRSHRCGSASRSRSSGLPAWRRPSPRCPTATSAPSRASTPPSRSGSATSGAPGRSARGATRCEVRPSAGARARRRHRHRCRAPGWRCARGASPGSTRSRSAASTPAATSTWRSASRASSGSRAAGRRCSGSPTSTIRGATISSLVAGDGPEQVVCLHGLGSNKTSFFETVSALTPDHTVHAIDLPGFGSSSKPARGAYDAAVLRPRACSATWTPWGSSARTWSATRWAAGSRSSWRSPTPTGSTPLSLLAPALAFRRRRELVPLVKLLRPELAAIPHPMRAAQVREQLLGPVRPARAPRPGGRRHRRRRVLPHLPVPLGADRVLRRGCATSTSTRRTASSGLWTRLTELRAAGAVRLGRQRPARAGRLLAPRRRGPPGGAARWCCASAATSPRSSCRSAPTS